MLHNISEKKRSALKKKMHHLGIRESDIVESFIRASGRGGQKVNKTSACVHLKHVPTGIQIKCQQERSQAINRFLARQRLADKIEALTRKHATEARQRAEKIRRQKRKRSKEAKEKILKDKRKKSKIKQLRKIHPREFID